MLNRLSTLVEDFLPASQFKSTRRIRNILAYKLMFADNTVFVLYNHQDR